MTFFFFFSSVIYYCTFPVIYWLLEKIYSKLSDFISIRCHLVFHIKSQLLFLSFFLDVSLLVVNVYLSVRDIAIPSASNVCAAGLKPPPNCLFTEKATQ